MEGEVEAGGDAAVGEHVRARRTTPAIAILDRLLHRATVVAINGDSYRMRAHRDAIRALRPAITGGEKP